jgi:hypothetical protein
VQYEVHALILQCDLDCFSVRPRHGTNLFFCYARLEAYYMAIWEFGLLAGFHLVLSGPFVSSRGSTGQLDSVLPTMIKALFEDFPGKSGNTRTSTRALQ